MKSIFWAILPCILLAVAGCDSSITRYSEPARPEPYEEEENPLLDSLKKVYFDQLYFAAAGTNVDSIRLENWKRNYALKRARRGAVNDRSGTETFANGIITATWHERGPTGEAGDMRVLDFDPATEDLYAISTVGHLWKGNLNGATWNVLNDDIRFETAEISVLPHNGAHRIFAIYGAGTDNKKIRFSDDEGQTWTTGTGFSFYDHWGKGRRLYTLSDNQTLYYLVHTWSASPWGELIQLYKSTDKGVSYTKVWQTPVGYKAEDVDLWKPYDSDALYLVDNRAQKYYQVTHNFATGATSISAPVTYTSQGIATGGIHLTGRYNTALGKVELFICHDANSNVYKTTDGATWTFLSTASDDVWNKGWLADPDNSNLYVGAFQLNKSADGINWTEQYPQWWRYYSHSKDSLHVDIMNLYYFKKSNGTPFILTLNHGGIHVTYDHFHTTANLGLQNLNVVTLYDQTTAGDGFLYCGAQDKGTFRYSGNSLANFNPIATTNVTTGDGMLGVFFNSDQSFFTMLQNGSLYCVPNRNGASYSNYTIPGTTLPGWIDPMVATPNFTDNKAYVAGGNLNGGAGSYLITVNVNLTNGVSWQPTQFNYDFRANSNNTTSVIKAIGVSKSDFNRLYVATQDATFFSSVNQGGSWTKHTGASLPSTMIPWDIKCADSDPNRVIVCGTGFSNAGVFQSTDGGATFTALTGNMPAATFYEIAFSTNEELLFAATSEGPYVYVFAAAQWYSLLGADSPVVDYNTVDKVGDNLIRFGTYGRGIWDFEIAGAPLPVVLSAFTARPWEETKTQLHWTTAGEAQLRDFSVEHSTTGQSFVSVGTVPAAGNSTTGRAYQFMHLRPASGKNYYRLKMRDLDGAFSYSPIQVVDFEELTAPFTLFPNLLPQGGSVHVRPRDAEPYRIVLYNPEGRSVLDREAAGSVEIPVEVPKGLYVYRVYSGRLSVSGRIVVE